MKKISLVIMAAGMGSRFGGLKQLEPVGPKGEVLMDYTLRDAARAGCGEVVFIIRREMEAAFRERILPRVPATMEAVLVYQTAENVPGGSVPAVERQKPWGTGQAVWVTREVLADRDFLVMNADDYYGPTTFHTLVRHLREGPPEAHALAGYALAHTLSESGSVSRGICTLEGDSEWLQRVEEYPEIRREEDGKIYARGDGGREVLAPETLVSMNAWAFRPGLFDLLEKAWRRFLQEADERSLGKREFYLPQAVQVGLQEGICRVKVCPVQEQWIGVTYPGDLELARKALAAARQDSPT